MSWKEKIFEEQMADHIDNIYMNLFKGIKSIDRSFAESENNIQLLLDKELGIDTVLRFDDGTFLTFQEKSRLNYYITYDDFTFEYYNDPITKEEGEWFKLASQYYFYGFANKNNDGYEKVYILNVPAFRLFLKNDIGIETLKYKYLMQNKPPAKANFFAIPFNIIPDKCFLYKSF